MSRRQGRRAPVDPPSHVVVCGTPRLCVPNPSGNLYSSLREVRKTALDTIKTSPVVVRLLYTESSVGEGGPLFSDRVSAIDTVTVLRTYLCLGLAVQTDSVQDSVPVLLVPWSRKFGRRGASATSTPVLDHRDEVSPSILYKLTCGLGDYEREPLDGRRPRFRAGRTCEWRKYFQRY